MKMIIPASITEYIATIGRNLGLIEHRCRQRLTTLFFVYGAMISFRLKRLSARGTEKLHCGMALI